MNEISWRAKWSKDQIKAMLLEQSDAFWGRDTGIPREQLGGVIRSRRAPHAVVVSGLRRVGKSTLLAQTAHALGRDSFYYLDFEDDRFLAFRTEDGAYLHQILVELFGERGTFIVDEVQNIPGWEHLVRRFMDLGFKFYISGSNASLLSPELGTRLTGRHVPIELFPFSFREYLVFRGETIPDRQRMTTVETARLERSLDAYTQMGGIPDALKYPELPILRTLYDDVLYRDIAARHRVDTVAAVKELAFYFMSNPARAASYNKLKGLLHLGSVNTIKSHVDHMRDSWLIFTLNLFDESVKRQQIAPKKVYAVDTGMARAVGFGSSPNQGALLENLVFLSLRRQSREIYYLSTPGGYEVDFYLPEKRQLIQVTRDLEHTGVREREVRALEDAVGAVKANRALILCDANDRGFKLKGVPVEVRSTAEWLLGT